VFSCLMLSFPAWCFMYVYSTLLTANGSMKALNIIAFAGVVFNLSLNYYLVPRYKAFGGAITSLITQTGLALAFFVFAVRIIKLPWNVRWLLAHVGYMILVAMLGYGINRFLPGFSDPAQLIIFGSICILLIFLFRFVSVANLRQFINKRIE